MADRNGDGLVVRGDLGLDERREFAATAREAIESADQAGTYVELDCSTVGMLVTVARAAQRYGTRVTLIRAPESMRAQLEAADVAHFFDFGADRPIPSEGVNRCVQVGSRQVGSRQVGSFRFGL
jgi:ABC-type transporter Mla MlaB component